MVAEADRHHLGRVLRLRDGEAVAASDGAGRWRRCQWRGGGLSPEGDVEVEPPPSPPIAVGFVPTKADRPEWAVQKLTELGVDRIVVLRSARSVVRWEGDRAASHLARLGETARQAGMQSRRVRLPAVEGVTALADLDPARWSLAEPGGGPLPVVAGAPGEVGVAVGPEGGFTAEETGRFRLVDLGDGVLRAETATVAVAVLLAARRSS